MKAKLLVINLYIFCGLISFAQVNSASSITEKAAQNTIAYYKNYVENELALCNGPVYRDYLITISEGNPFLDGSVKTTLGNIVYDGVAYENVPLLYDIFENKLITVHPITKIRFSLRNDKVDAFSVSGHYFLNIRADSNNKIMSGFYEAAYLGQRNKVFELHQKVSKEDLSSEVVKWKLNDNNLLYIYKNGKFYEANNKRNILNIYPDKKKELSQLIRKENLKFRKNKKQDIITIAKTYDELL